MTPPQILYILKQLGWSRAIVPLQCLKRFKLGWLKIEWAQEHKNIHAKCAANIQAPQKRLRMRTPTRRIVVWGAAVARSRPIFTHPSHHCRQIGHWKIWRALELACVHNPYEKSRACSDSWERDKQTHFHKDHHRKERWHKTLCMVNDRWKEALNYRTCHLTNNSSIYDTDVAKSFKKWAKRLKSLDEVKHLQFRWPCIYT